MVDATQQSWGRIGSRLIRDKSAGRPFIRTCHCHIYWMHLRSISLPWALGPSRWHGETSWRVDLIDSDTAWWPVLASFFAAATKPPDVTTIVWRNMFGRFCSEWTCGRSCLKHWANWPKKQTMLQDRKKTSFFRRRLLIRTNSIVYSFLKTRTHGKNGTKSTYEPTNHTWNSTPSQHFVHLQPNAMLISLRVAITAVT